MSKGTIRSLQSLVRRLKAERQAHERAIAEIDGTFASLGIESAAPKKRGRRPGRSKKTGKKPIAKRKRKKYRRTASELVLATIKKGGAKGATGAQITKAWKAAGRTGDAYNTLSGLSKSKKIKRNNAKGGRGSRYTTA